MKYTKEDYKNSVKVEIANPRAPYHRCFRPFVERSSSYGSQRHSLNDDDYAEKPYLFTRAFLALQKEMEDLFSYVEPADNNKKTFSYKIQQLLIRVCIELEANFKAIMSENKYSKDSNWWGINDYWKINASHKLSEYKVYMPTWEGKNTVGAWPILTDCGRIFKVNGSATFADTNMVSMIRDYEKTSVAVQLIQIYGNSMADTSQMGFQFRTHLSFAWEDSSNSENMMRSLSETLVDTEQVVVIGYSFPFFNRTTDRELFKAMPKLKKVYVQDINPNAVEDSLRAVLADDREIEVVKISNCGQFYLPREL